MFRLTTLLVFISCNLVAQDISVQSKDTLFSRPTKSELMKTDNIGYIYLADNDLLLKMSPQGDTLFVTSNKLFGEITDIDGSFALKPLLFYKDQNMVSILDNTLSQQGEPVLLDKYEIYQPQTVCNSYSGNTIWVYNLDNSELIKLDVQEGITFRTGNLTQQTGLMMNITDMVEFGNKLYLNNPEYGVMVFDIFGTYIKLIPIKGAEYIQVFEYGIGYKKEDVYNLYSSRSLSTASYQLKNGESWAEISKKHVYLKNGDILSVLNR